MPKIIHLTPKPDEYLTAEYLSETLEDILESPWALKINFDPQNKYSLLTFGMLFSVMHYSKSMTGEYFKPRIEISLIGDKEILKQNNLCNVLLDLAESAIVSPTKYTMQENSAYMISSVRGASEEAKTLLIAERDKLVNDGLYKKIHLPIVDTFQKNPRKIFVCLDNLCAMANAQHILMRYDPQSMGSIMDTGMEFALMKHFDDKKEQKVARYFKILNRQVMDFSQPYSRFLNSMVLFH